MLQLVTWWIMNGKSVSHIDPPSHFCYLQFVIQWVVAKNCIILYIPNISYKENWRVWAKKKGVRLRNFSLCFLVKVDVSIVCNIRIYKIIEKKKWVHSLSHTSRQYLMCASSSTIRPSSEWHNSSWHSNLIKAQSSHSTSN